MGILWLCIALIAVSEYQVLTEPQYKDRKFYSSKEWRELRRKALDIWGASCMSCDSEGSITVDHVYPRSLYPDLELVLSNLQILCASCNSKKSNKHTTDYRFKQ